MKKIPYFILVILVVIFIICGANIYSEVIQEEDYVATSIGLKIPKGMELRKIGGANILMPIGGKLRKEGDTLVAEGADEYAARQFMEMGERLNRIEKEQEIIREEIDKLKETISKNKEQGLLTD